MSKLRMLRYGLLGIPLAFVGLPLYVHVPKFYAEALHVDLGSLGLILLVLRLFDTAIDPVIGIVSDRLRHCRARIMALCLPILAAGYYLLFSPPVFGGTQALWWLGGCLSLVYFAFSTLMINYYAAGVDMAEGYNENTRIAAWREGSMLAGVLLASLLPSVLASGHTPRESYHLFGIILAPLLFLGAFAMLSALPAVTKAAQAKSRFWELLGDAQVRWALLIALLNAIPTAITSTLFLFFTSDILQSAKQSGPMLAVYFLSAALCMPLWTFLSARLNKRASLLIAMATAIVCFGWAWCLGAGDVAAFYVICVLSGATLGADAALLPSLFADVLADRKDAGATAFGLWNVTAKLTMALAAGIALPILSHGGYHSGEANSPQALATLSFCYALLPCFFKALAILMLTISPLDRKRKG